MKIILPILILFFVTSCAEKCDCSYNSFEKIKLRTNKKYVKKVLKMSPTIETKVLDYNKKQQIIGLMPDFYAYQSMIESTYECDKNKIKVYYMNDFVIDKTFNY
jgi:hypothetical protein